MPEAWVRGAILIRMIQNSLIRSHSSVWWELIEKINQLLCANITPFVPLHGTKSSSSGGMLPFLSLLCCVIYNLFMPRSLSIVLHVGNLSIRVFDGPAAFGCQKVVSSRKALEDHGIEPIPLALKEHLGILNGTALSAVVASLALHEAIQLAFLTQICTAMGTEVLASTCFSFDPFISNGALPYPGQIEASRNLWNLLDGSTFTQTHKEEVTIDQDEGVLRQDCYLLGPHCNLLVHRSKISFTRSRS